jgi:hypothetical protein
MTEEGIRQDDLKDRMTRKGYWFVGLWAFGILLLYFIGGYLGVRTLLTYRAETEKFRQTWIESVTTEPDARAPEIKMAPGAKPVDVIVGVYINSIGEISLKESGWTADFDIWFRWTGDQVRPGENFQVVNGQIDQREKKEAYVTGQEHYERSRVKARLTKFFDASRFPFSDQGMTIQMEDSTHGAERLRYVADEQESGINRLGVLQSLKIKKSLMTVKLHSYGSRRGDLRLSPNTADVHSRFILAMLVSPPSTVLYMKMFQALFASIAIAFVVFFIKPIHVDPRFGLGVGALFAAIGNNIFVGTMVPPAEEMTLTAMVNAIGLATIFLTLVQSTISLYILDTMGKENLRRFFDKVSFVVFLVGYAVVNLMLPLAARP